MRRMMWLTSACLLGGLMMVAVTGGLRTHVQAAEVTAPLAPAANAGDVVINEVAWMGTEASYSDEWIELYNTTDSSIDIGNWSIYGADTGECLNFSKADDSITTTIPAYDYLIYANDSASVNAPVGTSIADIWDTTIGMNTSSPGQIILYNAPNCDGNVIDTANQATGDWFAGDSGDRKTMERKIPTGSGTDSSNWDTNNPITASNGLDASDNPISGTPKCRNSASTLAADLMVGFDDVLAQVNAGARFTYTLHFRNAGNITTTNTRLTNTLSTGLTFYTQTSSYTFTQPASPTLVWESGGLPVGAAHSTITVVVDADSDAIGMLNSVVTAATSVTDTPLANNTAAVTIAVQGADLAVAKSGLASVEAGGAITYHIILSNTGVVTAVGVLITDTLPTDVYSVAADPSSASQPDGALVWDVGDIPADEQRTFTITGRVTDTATGSFTNHVTATIASSETVTANNTGEWTTMVSAPGTANMKITALHPSGYDGYNDEAVQLMNLGAITANLGGWYLADDPAADDGATFPASATLASDASIWWARSAVAFAEEFGFKPDYETDDTDASVPELTGSWPNFTNNGDECALFDDTARLMDVLVYGDSIQQTGWSGAAVPLWKPSNTFAEAGQIIYRKLDQITGRPVTDTNTAADWAQDPNDHINGRKVRYPGWDLDEFFQTVKVTETAYLTVVVAPDNAYEVIKQHIESANSSIQIEGYTFENADLIDAIVSRAQAGVMVRMLLEGGRISDQERWFCQRLNEEGGEAYFMHNDAGEDIHDRYRNQHAKFMILDNQILIVGSENFNYSAFPADDKSNGTWGRRGMFFITDAPGVVTQSQAIFDHDLDTAHKDIVAWDSSHPRYGEPTPGFTPSYVTEDWVTYTVRFSQPLTLHDTFAFEVIQSPENSLRDSDSLLGLVERTGSGDTVLVEQLYEREHWGATDSAPDTDPNPRLEAYIAAARRGATVHILLNGSLDTGSVDKNTITCNYVNAIAQGEGLNLEAQLGDPAGRGIHNKMVLVDLHDNGSYAHVGSINGSEASSKINRELALQVKSDEVYQYLARVFETDWQLAHPIFLPLVMRNYTPPAPPVEYVVFSEVYYAGSISAEWVEIYNPTQQTIDLSNYKIGDAETSDRFEGMYQFPSGATIPAQGVLVVAFDGSQVTQADFEMSDNSDTPDMTKVAWGTGDWALRNDGDQVLLLGPTNQIVDVVVWGDEAYPGVTPHPGVGDMFTHSLERNPPYYDTDDCSVDFRDLYPPDPGSVPSP